MTISVAWADPCLPPTSLDQLANTAAAVQEIAVHSGETPLEKDSREKLQFLNEKQSEKIDDALIDKLWGDIESWWDFSWLKMKINGGKNDRSQQLKARLRGIVKDIQARGGFRVLTKQTIKDLHLSEIQCLDKGHCTKVDGVYLPSNHFIYLSDELLHLNNEGWGWDLKQALLHEVWHAYQFTYRLPLDLSEISKMVQEGKIKKEEAGDYLDYYYESQANWKGLQLHFLGWKEAVDTNTRQVELSHGRSLVGGYALMTAAVPAVGFALFVGSFAGEAFVGNRAANRFLPEVAKASFFDSLRPGTSQLRPIDLPELVPIDDSLNHLTGFSVFGFDFHQKYGKKIQRTYLGDKFEKHDERNDVEIYNRLHNNYYDRVGLPDTVEKDERCRKLLEKVKSSPYSPMVAWLSLPQNEIDSCPAYAGSSSLESRDAYKDSILDPSNQDNPYHRVFRDGGDGGKPGLHILPQLRMKSDDEAEKKTGEMVLPSSAGAVNVSGDKK